MNQKHPNLRVFKQHGFIYQGESGGTQAIGRCPFCGHNKKFFINPDTKKWDCKICGRKGGYQMFLQEIVEHCAKNFHGKKAEALSAKRGIPIEALTEWGVGYNPVNETYVIPVWDEAKEELFNVRIYRKDGVLMNSAGCKTALYGWWQFKKYCRVIWLCEGEWDTIVMSWIIKELKLRDNIAVGVPGSDQFRTNWTGNFSGKVVHTIFDNDYDKVNPKTELFQPSAGKTGMIKVNDILHNIVKTIDFIHWPRIYHDKYDLNDLFKTRRGNCRKCHNFIESILHPKPPAIEYPEGQEPEDVRLKREASESFTGPGLHHEEVITGYRKWLKLKDPTCLDVAFGTLISNRLPGEPVWMFFIGPSGCGKSEIIMSLDDAPRVYPLSRLTAHTLMSGSTASATGGDPSLIPKLDGMVLVLKDFTGVLSMIDAVRNDIFGQLRDAYDGKCVSAFGTGKAGVYKSKFGVLAGVTDAIDEYLEGGTELGQRFLGWYFPVIKGFKAKCEIMNKAIDNMTDRDKELMRTELRDIATKVLDHDFGPAPTLGNEYRHKMMALAYLGSMMRGTVKRDRYSKEILRRAYIEEPTRIVVEMVKLSFGVAQYRGKSEIDSEVYEIIKRIAIGTAPAHLETILRQMYTTAPEKSYSVMDISDMLGLPGETSKRFGENLQHVKILKNTTPRGSLIKSWRINEETLGLIEMADLYSKGASSEKTNVKEKPVKHKRVRKS